MFRGVLDPGEGRDWSADVVCEFGSKDASRDEMCMLVVLLFKKPSPSARTRAFPVGDATMVSNKE